MSAELHPSGEVSELYSPWQRHSHNEVWKEFVWGGLAAAFGESMMHPIDTVKTRMQSGGKFINSFQRSTRFNEVLKLVLKNDGPRGLYRGITPGMTGSLATGDKLRNRIDISGLCPWCRVAKETIIHLFWACPAVRNFWSSIRMQLAMVFGKIKIETHMVLIGRVKQQPEDFNFCWHLIRAVCTAALWTIRNKYIFQQKPKLPSSQTAINCFQDIGRLLYRW
eukprot:c22461_g1_i2 orf=3-665(-)